jgi:cytoskeletal protein RodZ
MAELDDVFRLAAAVRHSRGIRLKQISDSTKITLHYLRAIEQGRFDDLPGGVYNTSYIRQYARSIDFDESELVSAYRARAGLEPEGEVQCRPDSLGGRVAGLLWLACGRAVRHH